ncbi:hypothetical protein FV296_26600, partial [Escherichia coli]|uniref:zinc-dependent metalloprotease n=1 Tax=Escherichia coli TaxID=562 RepID=UPI0011D91A33
RQDRLRARGRARDRREVAGQQFLVARCAVGAVGPQVRDSLWDQPDLMPAASDIDDPSRVIARLQGGGELDELDLALQELLDDAERDKSTGGGPTEAAGDDEQEPPKPE